MLSRYPPPLGFSAGPSSVTGSGTVVFSNSNGVSFGLNGSTITASVPAQVAQSSLSFSNANGVSFGTNGSTLTASVQTNYAGTGFTSTTTAGIVIVGTNSTNGLSLGVPAYLTTAALSQDSSKYAGTGLTTTTTAGTAIVGTNSTNGLSLGVPLFLTTARGSTDAIGLNTANTNVTWTVNSSGISLNAGGYAGTGFTSTTTAGTAIVGTHNTAGLSLGVPTIITNAITTQSGQAFSADVSSTFQTLTFQDSNGISFSNNAGAMRVTHGLQFTSNTSAITSNALNTSASRVINIVAATNNTGGGTASLSSNVSFSNANGATFYTSAGGAIVVSYTVPTLTNSSLTMQAGASTLSSVSRVAFVDSNGVSFGASTSNNGSISITATVKTDYLTSQSTQFLALTLGGNTAGTSTFHASNNASLFLNGGNGITLSGNGSTVTISGITQSNQSAIKALGVSNTGNTAGNTGVSTGIDWVIAGSNNITASQSTTAGGPNTIWLSGPTVNGANVTDGFYQNLEWDNAISATTSVGLSTALFVPIRLPNTIQWNNVGMIVSASLPVTSCANQVLYSASTGSSFQAQLAYSFGNSGFYDFYLMSRGAGGSSTDLVTMSSTRNTIYTGIFETWQVSVTRAAGGSISGSLSNTVSLQVSFPAMTSATSTSVNAATTVTLWGTGYSSWASTASNTTSSAINAPNDGLSIASTYPGTTAWSSNKLVQFNWGAGVVNPGLYWAGIVRGSSTSSATATAQTNVAAGRTYTFGSSFSAMTVTAQLTYVGQTNTIASSLGTLGGNSLASLAFEPGHGTYSATYAGTKTFMNNAGQANGEIALSDILTNVSFFKPWLQFNSNRV